MRRLFPMWSESSAWWNSKAECPIRSSGLYPTNSVTLEAGRKARILWPILFWKDNTDRPPPGRVILPALAVSKAKIHAVAGEEGVGIEEKLHAGGVRDGLAEQNHGPRSSGGALFSIKRTHVTCAVENLQQKRRRLGLILQDVERKTDLVCYKCISSVTISHCAHSLCLLKVSGDTGPSIQQIWCWLCAPCWSECSSFAGRSWSPLAFLSAVSYSNLKITHQKQNKTLLSWYKTVQEHFKARSGSVWEANFGYAGDHPNL